MRETTSAGGTVLELVGVSVRRGDATLLAELDWSVSAGQHWVVLGPNGSGKTTLVRVASLYLHPSTGTVRVAGEELGRTDVRTLRQRIGLASSSLTEKFRDQLTPTEIVMMGRHAALEPWWHTYTDEDRARAAQLLTRFGVEDLADRSFATLSSGERQRVLLARTLMSEPSLVLLDEPTAGLDLAGREGLVAALADWASSPANPPVVLVTHHVDEIPPGFTHALLLRDGGVCAAGPLSEVLTESALESLFDLDLALRVEAGRWSARLRT